MRVSNPTMRALADQMEREEVVRWANSLARARVTRWGGMISTPDDVLQVLCTFFNKIKVILYNVRKIRISLHYIQIATRVGTSNVLGLFK